MTDSALTTKPGTKSRCPVCDHPSTTALPLTTNMLPHGEMRNSVTFECDKGHCWTTSWTAEEPSEQGENGAAIRS